MRSNLVDALRNWRLLVDGFMHTEVIAVVVRRQADGWDWAVRDASGFLRGRGCATTQEAAMAEGWRRARDAGAEPFPDLIVEVPEAA
jgi:hypothetical protein